METGKSTPGPWQANISELEAHSALVEIRTAPNGDYKICDCGWQNARLIAKAWLLPEVEKILYSIVFDLNVGEEEAKQEGWNGIEVNIDALKKARDLLAKLHGD